MLGGFLSQRYRRFTAAGFYDPNPKRKTVRISNVYATPWDIETENTPLLSPVTGSFRLGRAGIFYDLHSDQLPQILHEEPLNPRALSGFKRWKGGPPGIASARIWIFATPSRQLVAALTVDTACRRMEPVIDLLEDCYYLDVRIYEGTLMEYLRTKLEEIGVRRSLTVGELLPERHQIAYGPALPERNIDDVVQRIIYRKDLPYKKQYSSIRYPAELNRRPGNTVAIGPYVSVICGHQNDVENSALMSAVQAVASAARLREIRMAAYESVSSFRDVDHPTVKTTTRRRVLEDLADRLTYLELELSHSVEAPADIGLLIPSLRVESYHATLFDSMNLSVRAEVAGRMLQRLERSINSGLTSVQSIERRNDEDRRLRWTVAVGFVTTVAIPASLALAYFGVSSKDIKPNLSMFDGYYKWVYISIGLMMVVSVLPSLALYLQQRRRNGKTGNS